MRRGLFEPSVSVAWGLFMALCLALYRYVDPFWVRCAIGLPFAGVYALGTIWHGRRYETFTRPRPAIEPAPITRTWKELP